MNPSDYLEFEGFTITPYGYSGEITIAGTYVKGRLHFLTSSLQLVDSSESFVNTEHRFKDREEAIDYIRLYNKLTGPVV